MNWELITVKSSPSMGWMCLILTQITYYSVYYKSVKTSKILFLGNLFDQESNLTNKMF